MNTEYSVEELRQGIEAQNRGALSKAITLVESRKPEHKKKAYELISALESQTGKSFKIGVSGTPGAGKSTFIDRLGSYKVEHGKSVAVLAVDPSSTLTKGSILGDKTRMEHLSQMDTAYIRPSPSKGYYGGIATSTHLSILLLEAFGFNYIIIETVGVGQSETMVADMVDVFVLITVAGGGDELQGIKRGIMERADIVFINKVDQDPSPSDRELFNGLKNVLPLFSNSEGSEEVEIIMGSALENKNIDTISDSIDNFLLKRTENGALERRRIHQNEIQFKSLLSQKLLEDYFENNEKKASYNQMLEQIKMGKIEPWKAAHALLEEKQ